MLGAFVAFDVVGRPEAGWALVPLALPALTTVLFAMNEGLPGTGADGS
ncbi:hypothetical protein STREPTOSP366_35480 [Streptomyces variabilis]